MQPGGPGREGIGSRRRAAGGRASPPQVSGHGAERGSPGERARTAGPRTQPGCVLARGRPRERGEGPARGLARVKRKDVEKEGRGAPPTRAQSGITFYRCLLSSKITVSSTSYLVLAAR